MTERRFFDTGDWANIEKMAVRMRMEADARVGVIITADYGAWSFCFSKGGHDLLGYVFSARLRQHSSKERDWTVLWRVAKLIGAPDQMPKTIETDPTASHYWTWDGTMSDADTAAAIERARKTVAQQTGN